MWTRSNGKPRSAKSLVVHNKLKPKKGELPADIVYIAGEHVPPAWNCYPWDAQAYGRDVFAHEALARQCSGERPLWQKLAAAACAGAVATLLLMRMRR